MVQPLMTKTEIEEQVKHWQERLGLGEWSITIKLVVGNDVSDTAWSTAHINNDQQEATFTLAEGRTDGQQVNSIVHEFVHIILYPMWLLVKDSDQAKEYWRAEERAVKRLTKALYQGG